MAEKSPDKSPDKSPEKTREAAAPKAKSLAECQKEYEALSRQVQQLAADRPKNLREAQARVKKEMGDFDAKFQALMQAKGAASVALDQARAQDKDRQDAENQRAKAHLAEQQKREHADLVAKRQADQKKAEDKRLKEAVSK